MGKEMPFTEFRQFVEGVLDHLGGGGGKWLG